MDKLCNRMRFFTAFKECRSVSYTSRVDDVKQLKDFIFHADSLENIQRLVEKRVTRVTPVCCTQLQIRRPGITEHLLALMAASGTQQ